MPHGWRGARPGGLRGAPRWFDACDAVDPHMDQNISVRSRRPVGAPSIPVDDRKTSVPQISGTRYDQTGRFILPE